VVDYILLWILVVENAPTVEFILSPLTVIGRLPTAVVKYPPTIHFVVLPHARVESSILIKILAYSISHAVVLPTLVSRFLKVFSDKLMSL
jgi:hypothetical protein